MHSDIIVSQRGAPPAPRTLINKLNLNVPRITFKIKLLRARTLLNDQKHNINEPLLQTCIVFYLCDWLCDLSKPSSSLLTTSDLSCGLFSLFINLLSVRRVRAGQGYRWSTAFAVRTTRRCIHPLIHTLGKFRAANPLTGVCLGSEGKPENLGNSTQTVNWTQDRTREPWSCATHSYNCITLLTIPHPSSTYAEMTHTERKR